MKNKLTKPKQNIGIPDINKIRLQHEAGISIRQLSFLWNIPYVTLYRALKGRKKIIRIKKVCLIKK